ncbi:MAG TPA: DsbA family protein [Roseovarius sp.]|nr:DsbA family protein [Roseovarius sp.]
MLTRRGLLTLGATGMFAGLAYGGVILGRRLLEPALAFEPMPGLAGFRRLYGGDLSAGRNPAFMDLGGGSSDASDAAPDCAALFAAGTPQGAVPIAYFSDARCVFCRSISPMLKEFGRTEGVRVTWHELPLLGPASDVAARATLAAALQGAQTEVHHRLMGTPFLATEAYLRQLANGLDLDAERLLQDMQSDAVDRQLARTAALARQFGFFGTPGLVIGRTVVLGNLTERRLRRILAAERAEPEPLPCG